MAVAARPRHTARWTAVAVGVVVLLFIGLLATRKSADTTHADSPLLGKEAPATTGVNFSGPSDAPAVSLAGYKGKYVLVNFFASWCIPCQQEAPALKAFYAEHASETDFAMIGIVIDDDASTMRGYVRDHDIRWPVGVDPHGAASLGFGTTGQPETYVIAPDGVAVCGTIGASTQAALEAWLSAARTGQECTPSGN